MIYDSIPDNVIIELLFNPLSIDIEFHLINLYNHIQKLPLINHINQLIRFRQYIALYERLSLENIPEKYPKPYYDINEVKQFIRMHYNMYEVRKNDRLVVIIINKQMINVQ